MNVTHDFPKTAPGADALRKLREDLCLSQSELAEALGFGKNGERAVRAWEAGEDEIKATAWASMRYLCILVTMYRALDPEQAATAMIARLLPESLR